MVFSVSAGVVNWAPVPKIIVSVSEAYQFIIPALVDAVNVVFSVSHSGTVVVVMFNTGIVWIVAVTSVLEETQSET